MVNYCKCGCRTEIADDKTWAHGHNRRGKILSDETKEKMSQAHLGTTLSDGHKEKIRNNHADFSGEKNPMYGKTPSNETKEKLRKDSLGEKNHYAEMDEPGLEICGHHIAYDFNDKDALVVQITRRFHGSIHHPKGIPITEHGYSLID